MTAAAHSADEGFKRCPKCGEVKSRAEFGKHRSRRDGLQTYCKPCGVGATLSSRKKNPDRALEYDREYRGKHKERYREHSKRWHGANPEYRAAWEAARPGNGSGRTTKWARANPEKVNAINANRRARVMRQTLPLSPDQQAKIGSIYAEAGRLTRETGIEHHVDHIVPLKGKTICGLHVPWNLRAIPALENISKGNKLLEAA